MSTMMKPDEAAAARLAGLAAGAKRSASSQPAVSRGTACAGSYAAARAPASPSALVRCAGCSSPLCLCHGASLRGGLVGPRGR